jgi:hypothetical protein
MRFMARADDAQVPSIDPKFMMKIARQRMKPGKAPGLTGWTRELFLAAFEDSVPTALDFIDDIARGKVDDLAGEILRSYRTCAWQKPGHQDKYRFIFMGEFFIKLTWAALTGMVHKDTHMSPRQTAFRAGGTINSIRVAQQAINNGDSLMLTDMPDAYFSTDRARLREKLVETVPMSAPLYITMYTGAVNIYGFGSDNTPVFAQSCQGLLCSLSYKQTHGIAYDQQQPDIMVCRNGDLPIHIDLAVAHCRRDAKQDTLLTRTLHKEGKYTDFDNGIGAHGFILPTTAAINKKNDRLLKQIADVTTKRGLYREMRNQITTALLNLTGNGPTWVPS